MADIDFLKTFPGSFRGVPFLVEMTQTSGGRKKAVHEFVNSNRRFVEDLGLDLKTFRVECLTTRNTITGNYQSNKEALIRALETPGPGILIHPFFGSIKVDVVTPYTVSESYGNFGVAYFSIMFQESLPNIFPTSTLSNITKIFQLAADGYDLINDNINRLYRYKNISPQTLLESASKIAAVGSLFESIFQTYRSGSQNPNEFNSSIQSFEKNVIKMAQDPSMLADNIVKLFTDANDFAANHDDEFNIGVDTFIFGDDDVPININTIDLEDRQNNLTLINEMVQTGGLIQAYKSAAQIAYQTDVQVNETLETLENQFLKFETYSLTSIDILNNIKELRNQLRIYIDANVDVERVVTINTTQIPMTILAYNYYGDTDKVEQLLDLNPGQDVSFVEGDVRIFAQ